MGKKIHYGWIIIFMGLVTTVAAHGFGRMAYTILLPAMQDGLHFDYTQLGLLGTANFIGYLSMAIIGGVLAARFGTRTIISSALLLMGITMILTGLAESFGFAFAMRLLTGLGNGSAFVPAMALGSAWFAVQKRGFATGIVSGGIGLGTFLSGIIVPFLLTSYGADGWRYSWYILGTIVMVIAVIVLLFLRNQPGDKGLLPVGQQEKEETQTVSSKNKVSSLDWKKVYRMKGMWYLGIVYFFYGLSYIIYMVFFAAYLVKEMGHTEAWAGGLWATVGGLSIFCGVLWGSISDRIGRGKGAALAYLVLGTSYIVYALLKFDAGFYLSAFLFGLTAWSIPTIMAAAAGDFVGPRLAPAGLGFITLFFGIGQSIGPALGGYLADVSHSFTLPFLIAGGISFVGMIFSFYLKKPIENF
ncbi:MAG: MFS transporter [Desulfobacula sp.]|jgi:sugar phosphate permease|uniref:MFS transporter n=1 Tax=Desulfobacula sp. TaxID=2593537 RepID=UPI001DF4FF46|nr:MFS transporter [Desulfobacula sp.]MBT3483906.1 MFS transporter [Desulfobacula sp.]MBT3803907.1 MFS transporter [Desulfobacula sp.]MBT4023852.1 MFS transporter [Desulfobacula sp.]MBT4197588.1 MFS transporter [Desulfobacula sp.]